jgi:hypothetical protein
VPCPTLEQDARLISPFEILFQVRIRYYYRQGKLFLLNQYPEEFFKKQPNTRILMKLNNQFSFIFHDAENNKE